MQRAVGRPGRRAGAARTGLRDRGRRAQRAGRPVGSGQDDAAARDRRARAARGRLDPPRRAGSGRGSAAQAADRGRLPGAAAAAAPVGRRQRRAAAARRGRGPGRARRAGRASGSRRSASAASATARFPASRAASSSASRSRGRCAPTPTCCCSIEPLAALDPNRREDLRRLIARLQSERALTTLIVTHDRAEAAELGERVALMLEGRIVQHDEPRALFERPVSAAVARFFGVANLLRGTVRGGRLAWGGGELAVPVGDGAATLAIRPEHVGLDAGVGAARVRGRGGLRGDRGQARARLRRPAPGGAGAARRGARGRRRRRRRPAARAPVAAAGGHSTRRASTIR